MVNYPRRKKNERIQAVADPESQLPKLTVKQESFVNHVLAGKTAREAYRLAYDCTDMSEESIATESYKLTRNSQIAQSIRIRQRIGLDESSISRENHLTELARLREIAVENQQVSAGVQAEHYRGRVAGLYNDKLQLQIGPTDEMLLSQIAALLGPETAKSLAQSMGYDDGETIEIEASVDAELLLKAPPSGISKE